MLTTLLVCKKNTGIIYKKHTGVANVCFFANHINHFKTVAVNKILLREPVFQIQK